jgi:hypothetical protein
MRRHRTLGFIVGAALALIATSAVPSHARVDVSINLGAPPQLVPVPAAPNVAYAPNVDANYFTYRGRYYVFTNGAWYASRSYNGPWAVVAPEYVPRPLLSVPVQYYHRPPAQWRSWHRAEAPRWQKHWGRRWDERRFEGQGAPREDRDRHDRRDRHDDRYDRR